MLQKLTYKIIALGCAMNLSDAERIKTVMTAAGFEENDKNPDVVIFVACSVISNSSIYIRGSDDGWLCIAILIMFDQTACIDPNLYLSPARIVILAIKSSA